MSDTHNAQSPQTQSSPSPSGPSSTPDSSGGSQPSSPSGDGMPSQKEILEFDPFGPKAGDTVSGDEPGKRGEPDTSADAPPAGQPTQAAPAATPAMTPAQPSPQDQMAQLVAAVRAAVQPQATPQAQAPAQEAAPKYNLALPPQVLAALRSEDAGEFSTGMHAVINGIANKVWMDVGEYMQTQVMPQITQHIQTLQYQQQQQRDVGTQFYGRYTNLAHEALRPIVQQAGMMVLQNRHATGRPLAWDDTLMDEIANTVYGIVPALRPAGTPQQQQQLPAGNGKQPFATGGGARPAGTGTKSPTDEMRDLLF